MTVDPAEHLHLASWVVHRMTKRMPYLTPVVREDLISCATVALVECAGRYDPQSDASFGTYAVRRMDGAVLDELRRMDWASRSVRDGRSRLAEAETHLAHQLGRPPTEPEVAAHLEVGELQLRRLRADVRQASVIELDRATEDGLTIDPPCTAAGPETAAVRTEQNRDLYEAIRLLPEQLQQVVVRNLLNGESLTVIAADTGLTLSRVSQARARALLLLRAALESVWSGEAPAALGGVRARREQDDFVARVTDRVLLRRLPPLIEVPA